MRVGKNRSEIDLEGSVARPVNILTAREVAALRTPGRHSDGGGLYLRITNTGGRSWIFMTAVNGKRIEIGLGAESSVTLAAARRIAERMREAVAHGGDPRSVLASPHQADLAHQTTTIPTFGDWADTILESLLPNFKNAKHKEQWTAALKKQTAAIQSKRVDEIDTDDVLSVLRPVWNKTPETARRLRGRIERVLAGARAIGHIKAPYENPARWKDHLEHLLTKRRERKQHLSAMPFADVPKFMVRLGALRSPSARALELTILCATRTMETLGAKSG